MRRCELVRADVDRARLGHVSEREILLDRERIELAPEGWVRGQRLELGTEDKQIAGEQRIVQRLDAQPVAR